MYTVVTMCIYIYIFDMYVYTYIDPLHLIMIGPMLCRILSFQDISGWKFSQHVFLEHHFVAKEWSSQHFRHFTGGTAKFVVRVDTDSLCKWLGAKELHKVWNHIMGQCWSTLVIYNYFCFKNQCSWFMNAWCVRKYPLNSTLLVQVVVWLHFFLLLQTQTHRSLFLSLLFLWLKTIRIPTLTFHDIRNDVIADIFKRHPSWASITARGRCIRERFMTCRIQGSSWTTLPKTEIASQSPFSGSRLILWMECTRFTSCMRGCNSAAIYFEKA